MLDYSQYNLYRVSSPSEFVLHVEFNRPRILNVVNEEAIFEAADRDPDVRVIVLSGRDRAFCAGLDLASVNGSDMLANSDVSRRGIAIHKHIKDFQECIAAPYYSNKPVIAVAHGPSLGLAIDILTAVDIRYASKDAMLSVREVEIGMAADIGTLQRLPKLVNNLGWAKEICFTARIFSPEEALENGLIDKVFATKDAAVNGALDLAKVIATKSPVAIHGTKKSLNYAMDHTHKDGLDQIAEFNSYGLGSDFVQGAMAARAKQKPRYEKL